MLRYVETDGLELIMRDASPPLPEAGPAVHRYHSCVMFPWVRGQDSDLRPSGYEPDDLPTDLPRINNGVRGRSRTGPWRVARYSTPGQQGSVPSFLLPEWPATKTHPHTMVEVTGVEPVSRLQPILRLLTR